MEPTICTTYVNKDNLMFVYSLFFIVFVLPNMVNMIEKGERKLHTSVPWVLHLCQSDHEMNA